MKPNDKAIEAARKVVIQRATHNFFNPSFLFGVIEAALDAAYAAQFKSEDYAGLIARLRDWGAMNYKICNEAADALDAVLAERDALNFELAARKEWPQARAEMLEELAKVRAERDDLLAHLAPVDDRNLEILAAKEWIEATTDMPPRTTYTISERSLAGARAAIAAIRPHIEAAEMEKWQKMLARMGAGTTKTGAVNE